MSAYQSFVDLLERLKTVRCNSFEDSELMERITQLVSENMGAGTELCTNTLALSVVGLLQTHFENSSDDSKLHAIYLMDTIASRLYSNLREPGIVHKDATPGSLGHVLYKFDQVIAQYLLMTAASLPKEGKYQLGRLIDRWLNNGVFTASTLERVKCEIMLHAIPSTPVAQEHTTTPKLKSCLAIQGSNKPRKEVRFSNLALTEVAPSALRKEIPYNVETGSLHSGHLLHGVPTSYPSKDFQPNRQDQMKPQERNSPTDANYRQRRVYTDLSVPHNHIRVLSRTLKVMGIPRYMSLVELKKALHAYGELQTIVFDHKKPGVAFVKAYSRDEARSILQNHTKIRTARLRMTWAVGFGPRDCSDSLTGVSTIPLDRLKPKDFTFINTDGWGGIGPGVTLQQQMVMEEPDIEIGSSRERVERPRVRDYELPYTPYIHKYQPAYHSAQSTSPMTTEDVSKILLQLNHYVQSRVKGQ